MKYSFDISNFLEEISSLSFSVVFFYLFALFIEESLLVCLLFSGTLHSVGYIVPFLPCFSLLFFSQLFVKPPQTTILPSCISFSLGWFWSLPPVQCFCIYLFTVTESVPSFPHFILLIFYLSICTHKFIFFLSVILFILMLKLSQGWP